MIKTMLRPFFKRFAGLFVSMVFVSLLSIGLLTSFGSMIFNLKDTYGSFIKNYQDIDGQIAADFSSVDTLESILEDIPELKKYDSRVTLDCFLKKPNGRRITSRIFSYSENDSITRFNVTSQTKPIDRSTGTIDPKTGIDYSKVINVSINAKFARNNNFKPGTIIGLGVNEYFINCFVEKIVETPEGIYPRANNYIWSDNQDFGYIYVNSLELSTGLLFLGTELGSNPQYHEQYLELLELLGIDSLDELVGLDFCELFYNQLLIKGKNNISQKRIVSKVAEYLSDEKAVEVKSSTEASKLPYQIYMAHAIDQLTVASVFLPVFFYAVTMIVIGLFMNQIIKTMTAEIGVLMSIGIDKKEIVSLFLIFGILVSIVAGILGIGVGYGINVLLVHTLSFNYSLSVLNPILNVWVIIVGIIGLVLFATLATFLSCLSIFKITPKDATISNESKRKKLPKWLEKFIDKAPMNIKLATNSIAQNPRRFFVSSFSIFASYVLILLSCFFYVSKNEMINQTVNRRLSYDAQVYMTERNDTIASELEALPDAVKIAEDCHYTYIKATNVSGNKSTYLECMGISTTTKLVNIPDETGTKSIKIKENGIILPRSDALALGVSVGNNITINNKEVKVIGISYQYFHPMTYLSKAQFEEVCNKFVTTVLVDVNNESAFLEFMSKNYSASLTVFTKSLSKDLHGIFNTIDIFIIILILFSLGMSFVILSIMSQNALLETKRQLSVFRAIGFTVGNISNMWTFTSLLQLLLGSLIAIPAGAGSAILLFKLSSSVTQTYPFIFDWRVLLFGFAFIFLVVLACHIISMFTIKKWTLADNLRCRE